MAKTKKKPTVKIVARRILRSIRQHNATMDRMLNANAHGYTADQILSEMKPELAVLIRNQIASGKDANMAIKAAVTV